ncbi:MAG: DUF2891 family protein [Pseudoclavibacter sp.]
MSVPVSAPGSVPDGAARWGAWAGAALANTAQEYPHIAAHLTAGPDDRRLPAELHPAFRLSGDRHSDVHLHWLSTFAFLAAESGADVVETDAQR